VHPNRILANLAASIIVVGVIAGPPLSASLSFDSGSAHAEVKKAEVKKAAPKKKAVPKKATTKAAPKQADQPRPAFSREEQAAARVPGLPGARVWGDSDTEFQKVLPQVSGPWIALSGGGADGRTARD